MPTIKEFAQTGEPCSSCIHGSRPFLFTYCAAPWLPPPPEGKGYRVRASPGEQWQCEHYEPLHPTFAYRIRKIAKRLFRRNHKKGGD